MSEAKYIVTGTDPLMPLGAQEAEEIAFQIGLLITRQDKNVLGVPSPLEIYRIAAGHMMKVGGRGAMPFLVGDETLFVPISESHGEYSYTGFELWQKIDGQWKRADQEAAAS